MFFAKGEIIMNNIYKVIWSKAKNCYVVASEIAKSHTKSASGQSVRRSALASLLALSLLCGGLGVASASLEVVDQSGTAGTVTIYTKDEVDHALAAKGAATDVATNAANIASNNTAINDLKAVDIGLNQKIDAEKDLRVASDQALDQRITAEKDLRVASDQALDQKIEANKTAIGELKAKDTELEGKINTLDENGVKYDTAVKDKITLAGAGGTTITNLKDAALNDSSTEAVTGKQLNQINERTAGIEYDKARDETTIGGQVTVNSIGDVTARGQLTAKGGVNAGNSDITTTGEVNAGSLNVTDASHLKGDVTMDKKLTVTGDTSLNKTDVNGALTAKGDVILGTNTAHTVTVNGEADFNEAVNMDKGLTVTNGDTKLKATTVDGKLTAGDADLKNTQVGGTLNVTGDTTLDGALTANGEAKFTENVTVGKDLTVDGKLNVGEIYLENNKLDAATGEKHDSATAITADGISNLAKVTEHGNTTESQFTHNKEGTINYAKVENSTGDWKVSTSKVTADGVSNKMTDSDGNTHTYSQTATESKEQLVNGDKSNFEKKTAEGNTISIKDKDAAGNPKSLTNKQMVDGEKTSVTNNESSSTINQGADQIRHNVTSAGKESSIEVKADGITNTSKDGTITNDAKDIVNNATGNMTNTVGGDLTTTVGGNELHEVTGKQTNTVGGGQINNITGDQTTTVTGNISNKAKNITNEAETKLTDKVGVNTRVLDGEGITDTVGGSTLKSRVTQKKGSIEAVVTDGTSFNHSRDIANASAKTLTGYNKMNQLLDDLNSSTKTIKNEDGKTTKTEQTALDITNTAKDGTITNDAKNIVNNASGNMTNTVGGDLKTTVSGNELHEVTGTKTENVTGKVTENYGNGQETNVTGDQNIHVTGDQTTIISGTQTTTATDINRNASSSMVDKVDNAYGTNTETKEAGKTTTDVSIKGTGEKGQYIRGANESRDYLIKGTLKNSETKTAEATSTEITDGNGKTSSTIQDVTQISGSVTDGTNTSVSNVKANSIDSAVTDGSSISTINQKKNSITSQVTDGTTITKTEQDTKNITNTAKDGTITNDAKNIVNNATGNMTNTVGGDLTTTVSGNELHEVAGKQTNKIDGDQENTIGGNQTTTVTGDISNKAENITNEANTKLTDKVGENTRVLDSEGITDTVGGSTFKQRIDKIMMESKDVSIKAEETLTNEAKVITNKASEVINNEAVNINNTATGIITSKASEIKNQADKLISNKVGENTWENMENGKITTSIKDGAKQNLTQSDAAGTTQSTVDGGKSTVTIQNADGLTDAVTDGRNTSVQNQTASAIAADVKDGAGNENASVATATTSANTIKNGTKANTVISTADGTSFINSEAAAPVTGASGAGTAVNTTIKGNTITTGKVTMDYAEVMNDLGVHGSATVDNDLTVKGITTTKTLKVTENATVGGTLDVTQKATFHDDVDIKKNLSVDGNATIKGDVTAKSYKVGRNTYIDENGINANNQKITNVADGSISEGSKDAVNGGQLYGVKRDLEHQVDKVGANAAAMANLRPMEFDPSSKWNIAAAIGNYGSETAAAIGAFYRPNDNVMVNLSTAFGTGENMVGGGVSVRLGKGGNKLSREETNALKAQVADLTARMDALLSVLNPNMSKDFPDVPENHWAYEAVSRLAGNDIVQGYPDGEFHGERTMTRYEMAEIIYNALSRGAEAERELVEEFKPELQAMAASEKSTAEKAEG